MNGIYVCILCATDVDQANREQHLASGKHAQVKLFLEEYKATTIKHKEAQGLTRGDLRLPNGEYYCGCCDTYFGERTRPDELNDHLRKPGHAKKVKTKWDKFQRAATRRIRLSKHQFPRDGSLEQNFYDREDPSPPLSPKHGKGHGDGKQARSRAFKEDKDGQDIFDQNVGECIDKMQVIPEVNSEAPSSTKDICNDQDATPNRVESGRKRKAMEDAAAPFPIPGKRSRGDKVIVPQETEPEEHANRNAGLGRDEGQRDREATDHGEEQELGDVEIAQRSVVGEGKLLDVKGRR